MFGKIRDHLRSELDALRSAGLYKTERVITTPQRARIRAGGREVLNLCANNYLGLADHPEVIEAAHQALDQWGYGLASVRFICGTQELHKNLEARLSVFLGTEATILFSSCWDANGAVFETLLGSEDAVISDELNHASIIDGIRLCKAQRLRYRNNDMAGLEAKLKEASTARFRLIVTDGVFSMDGTFANLPEICRLAREYDAMVMVDDSHAVGFIGKNGQGTPEHFGVIDGVDILTGTLGKALGGASGGYVSAHREIVDLLRQRGRPYLFSNTLAPPIAGASLKVLDLLSSTSTWRDTLAENTQFFRETMVGAGFEVVPGTHPITPIMLGDAPLSQQFAEAMLRRGVYVIGFFYPVVPKGRARIRTQISAVHSRADLEFASEAFIAVKEELGLQDFQTRATQNSG